MAPSLPLLNCYDSARITTWLEKLPIPPEDVSLPRPDADRPTKRRRVDERRCTMSPPLTGKTAEPVGTKRNANEVESESSHIWSAPDRSGSPSKRSRSSSPRKRSARDQIAYTEQPISIQSLTDNVARSLPDDLASLVSQLRRTAQNREGIIPNEVKDEVAPPGSELLPSFFRREATDGAEARLAVMRDLLIEAEQAEQLECHESTWNNFVHTPLLRLTYPSRLSKPKSLDFRIGVEENPRPRAMATGTLVPVTTAGICGKYVPARYYSETAAQKLWGVGSELSLSSARGDSKRVDYVLAMDIGPESPLQRALNLVFDDARMQNLPPHINQTLYPPLHWAPIACSIETKMSFAEKDTLPQLSVWVAAWYARLKALREDMKRPTSLPGPARMPSSLMIEVAGHDWQLYFVSDQDKFLSVVGPLNLGSTRTLVDMYTLIASLEAVKAWIESSFYLRMVQWFGCGEAPSST